VKLLSLAFLVFLFSFEANAQRDLTRYVDPFVGTGGHGHTFPGATVPFGMVQLSPDTRLTGWDGCSGYHYSDSVIYGFSHTHLSGTGISDYGDILLMPSVGQVFLNALSGDRTENGYASKFSHQNETASPGYYSVKLDDDNILVELTATARAGLHRYTFPRTDQANILFDLSHRDKVLDSEIQIVDGKRIVGWRRSTAWAKDQIVYFVAEFSQPIASMGVAVNDKLLTNEREARGRNLKAYVQFNTESNEQVLVRVGISAVSIEGAQRNLAAEIKTWDFDNVRKSATALWNVELNKIAVSSDSEVQLKNFYTALYHTMIAPNLFEDVDGQFRGVDRKVHTAAGFENYTVFSLWDTFRAAHPLYTIIDQRRTKDFVNTFLAQYEQGGRLPVWELAGNETDTMIGYHAVSVIADAFAKNIRGFDENKAFEAMKHSAELRHFGLASFIDNGFIGMEEERESVSKTLEYGYDDWCIAEMARMIGRKSEIDPYLTRAQSYKNVFDRETGFVRPRTNGGWLQPFDPREVNFSFTEANSWQYSFFAPQDIDGLVELMGGRKKFADKLDLLFTTDSKTTGREQADITGLIGQYAHGNEPSHHMAYLYNYVGQPWKTQSRVHQILSEFYKPTPDGLIGNEDCGQMSAWYILSSAGIYPVTPGSPVYVIGTPLFPEVRFNLENKKSFVISARHVSPQNIYIQSAKLNGKPYDKSFITHDNIMAGGELLFEMGPTPSHTWGVGKGNEPESRIDGPAIVPVPVIKAAGKTFKDRIEITLLTAGNTEAIYYTLDGSTPGPNAAHYSNPFSIISTTSLKAVAIEGDGRQSRVVQARFQQVPHDWSISLVSQYSSQYAAGGDVALIDGIRGTTNWTGGAWQGYQGRDFIAVVDLKSVQEISKLGAGFLQDSGSWIWMPRRVDFEGSIDGLSFTPLLSIQNDVPDGSDPKVQIGVIAKDFVGSITKTKARYVRVRAINYGKIPEWHPGSGGASWIFVDEIIVE